MAQLPKRMAPKICYWSLISLLFCSVSVAQDGSEEIFPEIYELEEFVTTGSLLHSTEAASAPVQVIERKDFDSIGYVTAEEFLQTLPINNAGAVPMQNNQTGFTPGASSVSLRGLGPDSTLILINGIRVAPWPTGAGGTTAFIDLNSIPVAAIKRIEVLKEGASATYGADAVAGVINIITNTEYEGAEIVTRYGNDISSTDSSEFYSSVVFGVGGSDANITGSVFYLKKNPISNADRPYSAVPPFLSSNSIPINIQVSAAAVREALGLGPDGLIPSLDTEGMPSPPGRAILATSGPSNPDGTRTASANIENNDGNLTADQYTYLGRFGMHSRYNYNLLAPATPRIERMGTFLNFRQKLSDTITASADFSYTKAKANDALAPTATGPFRNLSGTSLVIPSRTPFPISLPTSNVDGVAQPGYVKYTQDGQDFYRLSELPPGAYNPFNPYNQDLEGVTRARLEEFGRRLVDTYTEAYLATMELKGKELEVGDANWSFDSGIRISRVEELSVFQGVSASRLNRLMNAADPWFDPSSSQFLDLGAQPYNPFGASQFDGYWNENNRALAEHAVVAINRAANSEVLFAHVHVSSENLYSLPGGDLGLAFGYDWRRESISQFPDTSQDSGDIVGSSTRTYTNASRDIQAFVFESSLPIIGPQMLAPIYNWDISLAGRYEDFVTSKRSTFVPKISSRFAPTKDFVLRGSWSNGFREPSLFELFAGKTVGLATISNPWNPDDINPEIPITIAGNPELDPESSESWSLGAVLSPNFLKNFTLSADFWQIKRSGAVSSNPQDTADRIFAGDPLSPGEKVHLDSQNNILLLDTLFQNAGYTTFNGIDLGTNYILQTDNLGIFHWGFNFTWLLEALIQSNPNSTPFDLVGYGSGTSLALREPQGSDVQVGTKDGQPLVITNVGMNHDGFLEYKFTTTFGWDYRNFEIFLAGHYTSGFVDIDRDFQLTEVDDRLLWDMQLAYNVPSERGGWLAGTTFILGIENLFDTDPPAAFAAYQNSVGYPGHLYEPDGLRYYLSIKKAFGPTN